VLKRRKAYAGGRRLTLRTEAAESPSSRSRRSSRAVVARTSSRASARFGRVRRRCRRRRQAFLNVTCAFSGMPMPRRWPRTLPCDTLMASRAVSSWQHRHLGSQCSSAAHVIKSMLIKRPYTFTRRSDMCDVAARVEEHEHFCL
jgi:hypothetical protein